MLTRTISSIATVALAACAATASNAQDSGDSFAESASHGRPVKVMIISMFAPEGQVWLDHLGPWDAIPVAGLSPDAQGGFEPAIANLFLAGNPLVQDIATHWGEWRNGVPQR